MSTETTDQPQLTKAHAGVTSRFGEIEYRMNGVKVPADGGGEIVEPDLYRTCTYCGSLHINDALAAFVKPGTKYSGCDWKHGWPHKFYLDIPCDAFRSWMGSKDGANVYGERTSRHHKFYASHLHDATPDHVLLWNRVVAPLVGVKYGFTEEGKLQYAAPERGFQTWGVVGTPDPAAPIVPAWFKEMEF